MPSRDPEKRRQQRRSQYARRRQDPEYREKTRARNRSWKKANPEKVRAQNRQWRTINRERINERTRSRRASNPKTVEKDRARCKAWYAANAEKVLACKKAWVIANPFYGRNAALRYKYGITHEQYLDMAWAQGFRCALCDRHESDMGRRGLVVDHDHRTDEVRKLLCNPCNQRLGWYEQREARIHEYVDRRPRMGGLIRDTSRRDCSADAGCSDRTEPGPSATAKSGIRVSNGTSVRGHGTPCNPLHPSPRNGPFRVCKTRRDGSGPYRPRQDEQSHQQPTLGHAS